MDSWWSWLAGWLGAALFARPSAEIIPSKPLPAIPPIVVEAPAEKPLPALPTLIPAAAPLDWADFRPLPIRVAPPKINRPPADFNNVDANPIRVLLSDFPSLSGIKITSSRPVVLSHSQGNERLDLSQKFLEISSKPNGELQLKHAQKTWSTSAPLRLSGEILEISNYQSQRFGDGGNSRKYNRFRETIEVGISNGKWQIINELSIGNYLAGLAEETTAQPQEKRRAITVLARSYANYYRQKEHRKFGTNEYDLENDPATSQLYLGYDWEGAHPAQKEVVAATANIVLTYQGQGVIGPYFTQSAGRTSDRWQHQYPWTQSQSLPMDEGLRQKGHGVGMSGNAARVLAQRGYNFREILKYFFPQAQVSLGTDSAN